MEKTKRLGRIFDRLGKKEKNRTENAIIQHWRVLMIHNCAVKISEWCSQSLGGSEEEREVIAYGLEVLLDTLVKAVVILTAGVITGKPAAFGAILVILCSLRYWAGGVHCKTGFRCLVVMLGICFVSVYGAFLLEKTGESLLWIAAAICYPCMFFFAPGETGKNGYLSVEERRKKKVVSILWMTGELILIGFLDLLWWKWVLFLPVFIETISTVPCTITMRKEKTHEKHKSGKGN